MMSPRLVLIPALAASSLWIVPAAHAQEAAADSTVALQGDSEVTELESMTIEAENRVQIRFARPEIRLDLDSQEAPGLQWGSIIDVMKRTSIDHVEPMLAASKSESAPFLAQPWLDGFRDGPVARFRPQLEGVEAWSLTIADSRGKVVRTFTGDERPPDEIAWDGRTTTGDLADVGLTYSFLVEATDRAGNKRSFVGDAFEIPSYRYADTAREVFVFTGSDVGPDAAVSPQLLEIATRVNRQPDVDRAVRVEVSARSRDAAEAMAENVRAALADHVIEGTRRVMAVTAVATDAPEAVGIKVSLAP